MKLSKDKELHALLRQLHSNVEVKEDRNDYDLYRKKKVRLIDPSLFTRKGLVKASILSEEVRNMSNIAYEKSIRGMYVKVTSN